MKNLFRLLLVGACTAALAACGDDGGGTSPGEGGGADVADTGGSDATGEDTTDQDTGETDTGETDTGETDTGETDTGETDTGETDTGETDTGETDTGETDTGETDTGETDTGETDTGETDTGETDTGETDTGEPDVPIDCTDDEVANDELDTASPLGCGTSATERVAARGNVDLFRGEISIGERFVVVIQTEGNADQIQARVLTPSGEEDDTSSVAIDGDTVVVYAGDPFGFESGTFFVEITSSGCVDYSVTGSYCVDPFPLNEGDPVDVTGIAATMCELTEGSCREAGGM